MGEILGKIWRILSEDMSLRGVFLFPKLTFLSWIANNDLRVNHIII